MVRVTGRKGMDEMADDQSLMLCTDLKMRMEAIAGRHIRHADDAIDRRAREMAEHPDGDLVTVEVYEHGR